MTQATWDSEGRRNGPLNSRKKGGCIVVLCSEVQEEVREKAENDCV